MNTHLNIVTIKPGNIKYFTSASGKKFIAESATETGFIVHEVNDPGKPAGKSYEFTFDDILVGYKDDNITFFPTGQIKDIDDLFLLIKTLKRDANHARLKKEEEDRKAENERIERERLEAEELQRKENERRRRIAASLKLKANIQDDED